MAHPITGQIAILARMTNSRPSDILDPAHEYISGDMDRITFDVLVIADVLKAEREHASKQGSARSHYEQTVREADESGYRELEEWKDKVRDRNQCLI